MRCESNDYWVRDLFARKRRNFEQKAEWDSWVEQGGYGVVANVAVGEIRTF